MDRNGEIHSLPSAPPCTSPLDYIDPEITAFSSCKAVEDTQRRIDQKINELEALIITMKRRRNAISLVSRLPPEVLSGVFEWTKRYHWTDTSSRIAFSHVCSHWRTTAINSPELWSEIKVSSTNLDRVEEMLRRSKMVPLTIEICGDPLDLAETLKAIWRHIARVRDLGFSTQGRGLKFEDILPGLEARPHAPFLQKFTYRNPGLWGISGTFPEGFISGDMPSLRHIELVNCRLSWESPSLQQLTSLDVSFTSSAVALPVSISQILSCLSSSSNLKTLNLSHAIPRIAPRPPGAPPCRSILLPCLTDLSVASDVNTCSHLLDHLILPSLASLNLECNTEINDNGERDFSAILHTLKYWSDAGRLGGQNVIRSLACECNGSGTTILASSNLAKPYEFVADKPHLLLKLLDSYISNTIHSLCNALSLQHLESLHVENLGVLEDTTWLECFSSLEKLRSLHVRTGDFIEAISPTQMPRRASFPALQHLTFDRRAFQDRDMDISLLETCLQERCKHQLGIQELSFQHCYFFSEPEAQVAQLKKIVPTINLENTKYIRDSDLEEEIEEWEEDSEYDEEYEYEGDGYDEYDEFDYDEQ